MTSYMLSGKPILASVDGDSATVRYIREAQCGIVVEPDDKESLKEGFVQFGKMLQKELEIMGDNSKLFAEKNLTRKANLPKLIKVFDDILEAK